MTEKVDNLIAHLRESRDAHLELGKYILTADKSNLYPLDFLAAAVLNRSLALIEGFCSLIEARNFTAAAPLLRLQLDNCLRFSAAWLVEQPHDFAMEVLRGKPVRKQRTRDGQLMTDHYLVRILSTEAPWVQSVYDHTSGYVHFSEKHIFRCLQESQDSESDVTIHIGLGDDVATEDLYIEAILAFIDATRLLLKYAHGWGFTKDNPEEVAKLRERGQADQGSTD
jgi:hypothetical protein